jgi:hypothetical protein
MLDFLLSANGPDGKMNVVERNVYRYKAVADKSGKKLVLLVGVSTRSYGNDIDLFLKELKAKRNDIINALAQYKMPEIAIVK